MVRGASSTVSETLHSRSVGTLLANHLRRATPPPCDGIVVDVHMSSEDLTWFVVLSSFGIIGNGLLLLVLMGRSKLSTASFTYLRIVCLFQLGFFLFPLPLRFFTRNFQLGDTWTSTNFLPVIFHLWYFTVISIIMCLAVRLQLLINFVRRCRRWTSSSWIAWRKLFFVLPLGTIINVSLTFEYKLRNELCSENNEKRSILKASRSELDHLQNMALGAIRITPTFIYWLTVLMSISFVLSEKFVLPKLGSPFASRHKPLFSNLKPLVISLVISQSIVHIPATYHFVRSKELDGDFKLQLYTISFALPPALLLILSERLRSHLWLLLKRLVERKKEAVRKATTGDGSTPPPMSCPLGYSKLELENSEIEERTLSNQMVRALLHDDAIYRVRFAVHSTVPTVIEEEDDTCANREDYETTAALVNEAPPKEERTWAHASYVSNSAASLDKYNMTDVVDV